MDNGGKETGEIKMKRWKLAALIGALCCSLCACGQEETKGNEESDVSVVSSQTSAESASAEESASVEESVSAEESTSSQSRGEDGNQPAKGVTVEDHVGVLFEYHRHFEDDTPEHGYVIPQVLGDTEGAKIINAEIQKELENELAITDEDDFFTDHYHEINYDAYLNGDILSLILRKGYVECDSIWWIYDVFNYNVATGKIATNQELMATAGISQEEAVEQLRRAAVYDMDSMTLDEIKGMEGYEDESYYIDSMLAALIQTRTNTVSEANINADSLFYLDGEGKLKAYVDVDHFVEIETEDLELIPATNDLSEDWEDQIFLECHGNKLTLRFETLYDDETNDSAIEYGKEYEVLGVLKNYTDVYFTNGGYPFLRADDGTLALIDISAGWWTGTFSLLEPVRGYVEDPDKVPDAEELARIYEKTLFDRSAEFQMRSMGIYDSSILYVTEDDTALSICANGMMPVTCTYAYLDPEKAVSYEGYFAYQGTTQMGPVFYYYMQMLPETPQETDIPYLCGTAILKTNGAMDSNGDYIEWLEYQYLSGDSLFGTETKVKLESVQ